MDDYIYAIGGLNGVTPLSSVERYNINTKVWDQVANMPVTVWSGAAIAYHNKIIVVGKFIKKIAFVIIICTHIY